MLSALVALLLPLEVFGQPKATRPSGPVDISARVLKYNRVENIYTAEGDVELREGARRLNADFVLFNDTTKDAFAEGKVTFQDQEDIVHAERMTINLVTKRGTIENGKVFVKQGNFYMSGNEIHKTGEATYAIREGELTTCGWDRPTWTFRARDVNLTIEGYATTRSTTFTVLGHKVLYLPWGIFPVKTERQSGFLMPEFQLSSRDGTILRNQYFWAISKDTDATFDLDWIQDRGVKPGMEYRYFFTEAIKGSWFASFIDDNKYGHSRYQIKGEHEQLFRDVTLKAKINHVSDPDFLQDFGRTVTERSENSLKSTAYLEKPFARSLLTVEASNFDDLSQPSNRRTYKYLPSASYFTEYLPVFKNRFYTDVATQLTNFHRQEGDKATRLVVQPSLKLPYSVQGFNFLFSGSVTERAYYTDPASPRSNETKHHEAYMAEADSNVQFLKNSATEWFNIGQTQSIFMPRLRYTYIANSSMAGIPSIDPSDRIPNTNMITYSLNHYFNALSNDTVREISLIEISQAYGLSGPLRPSEFLYQGSGDRLSDITSRLTLFPHGQLWFVHQNVLSVQGKGLNSMTNSLHYAKLPYYQVDLAHSYYQSLLDEAWVRVTGRWREFDASYQIRYSLRDNAWVDNLATLVYRPKCWSVGVTFTQTRRPKDTSVRFSFSLEGITERIGGF